MNKMFAVLLFLLSLVYTGFSQETAQTAPLSLDIKTAVKMAREHSYSLKQSIIDLNTAQSAFETSWTEFYPRASLSSSLSTDGNSSRLGAGLNLSFSFGAEKIHTMRSRGINYDIAKLETGRLETQLEAQVKRFYWNLILYREQVMLLKARTDAQAKRLETTLEKYRLGAVSEIDKLSAEYDYQSGMVSLKEAENTYTVNLLNFTQLLGIDSGTPVRLTDTIPQPDLPAGTLPDGAGNPDEKLLDLDYQAALIGRDKSMTGFFPTLSFGYGFSWSFGGDPFTDSVFDYSRWDSSPSFSLSLSVPLDSYLPWSAARQNLMTQNAVVDKLSLSIRQQQDTVDREKQQYLLDLQQLKEKIGSLTTNVALAQRNMDLMEQLYQSGRKNLLEVRDTQNSLLAASASLQQARYDYLSTILDLEYLLGIDLGI